MSLESVMILRAVCYERAAQEEAQTIVCCTSPIASFLDRNIVQQVKSPKKVLEATCPEHSGCVLQWIISG